MKFMTSFFVLGVVALMAAPAVQADSVTTLYGSNNGGGLGGAVYFDATVGANALTVTGFDTNTASVDPFDDFQVWVLAGQAGIGNETSASWVQVATGSGTGAGDNNPTAVTLSNTFDLNPGINGIALIADGSFGHRYTNGDGNNQDYGNADLTLFLGSASNVPFTGGFFNPRVWNGTIYYNVAGIPEPSTLIGIAALGLIGMARRRR